MMFAIYIDDTLYAQSADEKAIRRTYSTELALLVSGFSEKGTRSVEIRKINDDGSYESSFILRENATFKKTYSDLRMPEGATGHEVYVGANPQNIARSNVREMKEEEAEPFCRAAVNNINSKPLRFDQATRVSVGSPKELAALNEGDDPDRSTMIGAPT